MTQWSVGLFMASLAHVIGAMFLADKTLVSHAKILAAVAECRVIRREEQRDVGAHGDRRFVWSIEFSSEEDMQTFHAAVTAMCNVVHEQ